MILLRIGAAVVVAVMFSPLLSMGLFGVLAWLILLAVMLPSAEE